MLSEKLNNKLIKNKRNFKVVNMNKIIIGLAALVFSGFVSAKGDIAVIDLQTAILQTNLAKQELSKLDSNPEFSAMKAKFDSLRADLANLNKDAQTNKLTWSAEQIEEFRKKVDYKRADLELASKKLKSEQNAVLQKVMQEMAPKARIAINEIATAEGISLLLDRKAAIYADASVNLTDKVTAKLNKAK